MRTELQQQVEFWCQNRPIYVFRRPRMLVDRADSAFQTTQNSLRTAMNYLYARVKKVS
ncbi:hypothetical protein NSU_0512 [Novosphingobium pentaromativorans US6-1]|uniref:Uncharacterized protein n=1 Tax=Novosphingobium pentaromativorans US6-1 TaxID=1088721 RepID=G6E841_9SPHN|nr:hypothetical protein NSU_0512 [Novosphingobium pentaromativorans US6-1]